MVDSQRFQNKPTKCGPHCGGIILIDRVMVAFPGIPLTDGAAYRSLPPEFPSRSISLKNASIDKQENMIVKVN